MSMVLEVRKNEAEVVQLLCKPRGTEFIGVVWTVDARLNRKDKDGNPNPWSKGQVLKRSSLSGMLGADYEKAVNRQREREGKAGDFGAQERKWGQVVKGTPLVVHTMEGVAKAYLNIICLKLLGQVVDLDPDTGEVREAAKPVYLDGETGETIPFEQVKPFLPARKKSGEYQGLEKGIEVRTPELGSIDRLTLRGLKVIPQGWGIE